MKCPKCQHENLSETRFCANCGTQLRPSAGIPSFPTATLKTDFAALAMGMTFAGRYQVIEELGVGGMGKVYKALDKDVDEVVALKLLKPEIAADEELLQRFRNELKSARKIIHKNVCRMYDLGRAEGTHFITMEYVPGEDLKSFIRRSGQLTVGKAVSIARQVSEGLAEAHRLGIVHRDLKPHNIMVDKDGNAHIMDFGIARSLKGKGITGGGMIIGTPEYMSPEQVDGKDADQRADIYALGVVLYEMLTGRVPFEGDTPFSVALKHKSEIPPDPRQANVHIPEDLGRLILKCLEKDKEKRFRNADELAAELMKIEESLPATEKEFLKRVTTAKTLVRRPRPFLIPGLAILAVIIIAGGIYLFRRPLPKKKPDAGAAVPSTWKNSIAVLPFRDYSLKKDQESFCDGMTDAIIVRLAQFQELKVTNTNSVMRYKATEKDISQIGEELGVENILQGTVQREENKIKIRAQLIKRDTNFTIWTNEYSQELKSLFAVQDRISMAIAEALKIKLAPEAVEAFNKEKPKNLQAYEYYLKGMHFIKSKYVLTFKEEDFRAGIEMFEKAIELEPDYPLAYFGLAWAYEHHYQATGNKNDSVEVGKCAEKAWQLDPDSAYTNACLGYYLYEYKGERDKAFELYKKALEINPNIAEVNFLAGISFLYHGLYEQGIKFLTKALALDPFYFWTPYKLAVCYVSSGDFEKADYYFGKYFELAPIEPLIFPGINIALNIMMKRYDKAEEIISRGEKTTPEALWVKKQRATLLAIRGEKNKALALFKNSEIYALLGMKDDTFACFDKEIRASVFSPYIYYQDLLHNSFYDRLRDDPRFKALLEREKKLYDEATIKYAF